MMRKTRSVVRFNRDLLKDALLKLTQVDRAVRTRGDQAEVLKVGRRWLFKALSGEEVALESARRVVKGLEAKGVKTDLDKLILESDVDLTSKDPFEVKPYLGAHFYTVDDEKFFFGRQDETKRAISIILDGLGFRDHVDRAFEDSPSRVMLLKGPSGCGKSSFVRAGVLASLQKSEGGHAIDHRVIAPEDFDGGQSGGEHSFPNALGEILGKWLNEARPGSRVPDIVDDVSESLGDKSLVLVLDQFEDYLDHPSVLFGEVMEFVRLSAEKPNIFVITVVNSARLKEFDDHRPSLDSLEPQVLILGHVSDAALGIIIEEPFRKAGYPLTRKVAADLLKQAQELFPSDHHSLDASSPLPLLSLGLARFFSHYQRERNASAQANVLRKEFGPDSKRREESHEKELKAPENLFANEIKRRADLAWKKAKNEELSASALEYGRFLIPLIRVRTPTGVSSDNLSTSQIIDFVPLRKAPHPTQRKLFEAFEDEGLMRQQRNGWVFSHRGVIDHWPHAADWIKHNMALFRILDEFRDRAFEWAKSEDRSMTPSVTDIAMAAEILNLYFYSWHDPQTNKNEEIPEFQLRNYCLEVFRHSQHPRDEVRYAHPTSRLRTTYVHLAAAYGEVELLRQFISLDKRCASLRRESDGSQPLMAAAWSHEDAVRILRDKGNADPLAIDAKGFRPLSSAISGHNHTVFTCLLEDYLKDHRKALFDQRGWPIVHSCAHEGMLKMFQEITNGITQDSDANALYNLRAIERGGLTPLHVAARNGKSEFVEFLLNNVSIGQRDFNGQNVLHHAVMQGQDEVIEILLGLAKNEELINDLDSQGYTPLMLAAHRGDKRTIDRLFELANPDPNIQNPRNGWTALHCILEVKAKSTGDEAVAESRGGGKPPDPLDEIARETEDIQAVKDIVNLLLEKKADPFLQDFQGRSPISQASGRRIVYEEFEKRVEPDPFRPISKDGQTFLSLLAADRNWAMLKRLIPACSRKRNRTPVSWNVPCGPQGATLLHLLVTDGAPIDLAMTVYDNGGDMTFRDERGVPPFHLLCLRQDEEAVRFAVEIGSDYWEIRDALNRTPQDFSSRPLKKEIGAELPKAHTVSWDTELNWQDESLSKSVVEELLGAEFALREKVIVERSSLPFYQRSRVQIIRFSCSRVPFRPKFFLQIDGGFPQRLDGNSPLIHQTNRKVGVKLVGSKKILDYLRFFCYFVRGEEGAFFIVSSNRHSEIPDSIDEAEKKKIAMAIQPTQILGDGKTFPVKVSATVWYGKNLFFADFAIKEDGMIEMERDYSLLRDRSVALDCPLG